MSPARSVASGAMLTNMSTDWPTASGNVQSVRTSPNCVHGMYDVLPSVYMAAAKLTSATCDTGTASVATTTGSGTGPLLVMVTVYV